MENYKRITDKEVFQTIDALNNNDEDAMKMAWNTQLLLLLDIRHFLRKMYTTPQKLSKERLFTDPSKASKNDIVIGTVKE